MKSNLRVHLSIGALALSACGILLVILACGGGAKSSNGAAAPVQHTACTQDSDCKGERVCEQGHCITPR